MSASERQGGSKWEDVSDRLYHAADRLLREQGREATSRWTPEELLYRTLAEHPLLKLALVVALLREAGTALRRWLCTKRTPQV